MPAELHPFENDNPTIPVIASSQMGQQLVAGPGVTNPRQKPINQSVARPVWAICLNIQQINLKKTVRLKCPKVHLLQ
jgi:hypothetical protein